MMFNMFKNNNSQKVIRELVLTDLKVLPRNQIYWIAGKDNSYYKIMPGRRVSFFCGSTSDFPLRSRISSFG